MFKKSFCQFSVLRFGEKKIIQKCFQGAFDLVLWWERLQICDKELYKCRSSIKKNLPILYKNQPLCQKSKNENDENTLHISKPFSKRNENDDEISETFWNFCKGEKGLFLGVP